MIIRLLSAGKSFKGLGRYLAHDADKAPTSNRVEWTHTLNLTNDDAGSAIDEMLWTYRAADQLKRAAGIRTGSHPLKNPVKHFSLGWDRSDPQSRDHMIETVKAYLDHMGWAEHQAVIFCHNDRHPHVHVMLNAVHPETGRALNDGHEWRRSQSFGLRYEQEHGKIFCEQRLLPEDQREPAPTREAWMKMKEAGRQFEQAEAARMVRAPDYFERGDKTVWEAKEWEVLKSHQREGRDTFFIEGKQAFREVRNAIFREVRTEFRAEWKSWFEAKRHGMEVDRLADMKADILSRQNAELETRRDAACAELREMRDADYRQILLEQKMQRAELTARQKDGSRTYDLLDGSDEAHDRDNREVRREEDGDEQGSVRAQFGAAARETTEPERETGRDSRDEREPELDHEPAAEKHRVRDPLDAAGLLGLGALGAIANVGERLFDGFFGGVPKKPPRQHADQPKPSADNRQARSTERQSRAEEQQADEAARLEAYWAERRRSRGRRDRD